MGRWGRGLEARAGAGECVFLAVTSLLVLLLLSFLGRTGLLADLLPSFAVEIMPGIQSFHPSITQSSAILSVYPSTASLCSVCDLLRVFCLGIKREKPIAYWGSVFGWDVREPMLGLGEGMAVLGANREMVDVTRISVRAEMPALFRGGFISSSLLSPC